MPEKQMCKNEWPDWRYSKGQENFHRKLWCLQLSKEATNFFIPIYQLGTRGWVKKPGGNILDQSASKR